MAGARRAIRKNPFKALACTLSAGACALFSSLPVALAHGEHVENRCPKLTPAEYEELDARILLLLKSESTAHALPSVFCGPAESWVEWEDERLPIAGREPLVDEVVEIVEGRLHDAAAKAEPAVATPPSRPAAVAAPESTPPTTGAPAPARGQPADRTAKRAVDARGGGILVGIEGQLPTGSVGAAFGPMFEFSTSLGPVLLGARESFHFTAGRRSVVFMDFEGVASYGAPLDPDALLGASLGFGPEWMVAYPEGNSSQAAVVPTARLGPRIGHSFGLVGIWAGVDVRVRLAKLSLRSQTPLVADDVQGSLTFGVSFVDWSRK